MAFGAILVNTSSALVASEAFRSRRWDHGEDEVSQDVVAAEAAVALHYNRTPYVVMMATPSNIEDLVLGFSLSEGIIERREDLSHLHVRTLENGILLTFAPTVWYSSEGAPPFGLSPLEDQQLGGLIMWVPGGLGYIVGGSCDRRPLADVSGILSLRGGKTLRVR